MATEIYGRVVVCSSAAGAPFFQTSSKSCLGRLTVPSILVEHSDGLLLVYLYQNEAYWHSYQQNRTNVPLHAPALRRGEQVDPCQTEYAVNKAGKDKAESGSSQDIYGAVSTNATLRNTADSAYLANGVCSPCQHRFGPNDQRTHKEMELSGQIK
ncbi:3070_t:CDS:2, partial [Acaulospora colombiana]